MADSNVEAVGPATLPVVPEEKPAEEEAAPTELTETKSKIYVQLISAVVVNFTLIAAGIMYSWTAISLEQLESAGSDIPVTSEQGGWIATILLIGGCLGPVLSLLLIDRIGRKWFLYSLSLPTIACWLLIYFATSWEWILVARLFGGIPLGAYFTMVPLYLGELVETRIRGAAGAMIALSLNIGFAVNYGVAPLLDRKMMCLISLVPTAAYLISSPWIPDSPYYYVKRGNLRCAAVSLTFLRRKDDNVAEINEMQHLVKEEKSGGLRELFRNPASRKGLLLLLLLLAGQQFSGLAAIQSYYGLILRRMNIPLEINHALLIISGINVVSSLLSAAVVDRMGRKPVFLVSSIGTSICLLAMGAYFLLEHMEIDVTDFSVVPLVVVLLYTVVFSFGMAQIPAIVQSEVFPINVKSWASAIANTYGSLLGMLVTKSFQSVADAWGYHVILLTFAGLELIVAAIALFLMPETKQKSFVEIQELLKGGKKTKKETKNVE